MANFNKVILMGNLTRDPVLKYLPSGSPVADLGLAVNRSWTDQGSGEKREAATFVDCRAVGKQAEVICQYMKKGRPILIEGRLEYRAWEAKDGTKRNKLDVFIESFQFVGGRRDDQDAPGERVDRGAPSPQARAVREQERPSGGGAGYGSRGAEDLPGGGGPFEASAEETSLGDDDVPF